MHKVTDDKMEIRHTTVVRARVEHSLFRLKVIRGFKFVYRK